MAAVENSRIVPVQSARPETATGTVRTSVGFSYVGAHRHVTEKYLSDAFDPEHSTHFDLQMLKQNVSVLRLLDAARTRGDAPSVYAHLVDTPALPHDLQICPIQTAALDIDSFWWTSSRIRWSLLFDYVFVWHKSLVPLYAAAGHPNVIALPHAVDADAFKAAQNNQDRIFDVGWVGGFGYAQHARRRRIINALAVRFKLNDFQKQYSKEQTAEIYCQSKIVVNVSRDECPSEANMRCYEAMAGGALLITQVPTELTEWGFREAEHFIGWRNEAEIADLVDRYLHREKERQEIARAGQELTFQDFTFQRCRDKMLAAFQEHPNQFFAPARNWPVEDVSLAYLEYYYRFHAVSAALEEFSILKKASRKGYWKGLPMILKMFRQSLKRALF
jgi:hypothetical protein